jgi:hypothetical protein
MLSVRYDLLSLSRRLSMSNRWLRALIVSLPLAAGCGVIPDLRLGADAGIPKVSGFTTIAIPQDYVCGDPITDPNSKYTVTSTGDQASCTFMFRQDVVALTADDYANNPQLEGAQAVNGIELVVDKFNVVDPATGEKPGGLKSVDGKAFGITVLTEEDFARTPPFSVTVDGPPVDELKAQVQAKQDIVIPVDVVVVVALEPAPPAQLQLDFDAQPVLLIGFDD